MVVAVAPGLRALKAPRPDFDAIRGGPRGPGQHSWPSCPSSRNGSSRRPGGWLPNMRDYRATSGDFSWDMARKWLAGTPAGGLNIAHEAVDRHTLGAHGARIAMRWLGKHGEVREYSYHGVRRALDSPMDWRASASARATPSAPSGTARCSARCSRRSARSRSMRGSAGVAPASSSRPPSPSSSNRPAHPGCRTHQGHHARSGSGG